MQEVNDCFTGTLTSQLPWSFPRAAQARTASLSGMWDQPAPVKETKEIPRHGPKWVKIMVSNCASLPRTRRFPGHGAFHFKTVKNSANWDELVTLVKTTASYVQQKEEYKSLSVRSGKSKS